MTDEGQEVVLSVVSPVYGCVGSLHKLVDGVAKAASELGVTFEVVLVDDASPDGAWQEVVALASTRPWLRGLRLSRNFGQHSAIDAGLRHVSGQWVVVMDCDLQDPPNAIPDLFRHATDNGYDAVFALRRDRQDSATKRFSSWIFYRLLTWLTGVPQDRRAANFGVFSRQIIDVVTSMPEQGKAFPLMVRWSGFRIGGLEVEHAARAEGKTSYSLGKLLRLAMQISLGYSDKPLRMVAQGGIVCAVIAFVMAAVSVFLFIEGSITVAGYTSIVASTWLLGGLTLLSLGVVGLYVGQVFENVQGRPTSIVAEIVNE